MFVGVGAARVHGLFEQARQAASCIIFIDELDALGKMRSVGAFGGNDEKEQSLNQLLAELDGFDPREGVVLLAATNRPEIQAPALLRAGRIDRQVLIDHPDRLGRQTILRVHLQKILWSRGWMANVLPTSPRVSRALIWPTWSTKRRSWPLVVASKRSTASRLDLHQMSKPAFG